MTDPALRQGDVLWATLGPGIGREQSGRRPCVVISGPDYLDAVTTLVTVAPVTSVHRGWRNHVELSGTTKVEGHVMTEQPTTVSRERIDGHAGRVSEACLDQILTWVHDFLHDPHRRSVT